MGASGSAGVPIWTDSSCRLVAAVRIEPQSLARDFYASNSMGGLSVWHLLIIAFIILLLFGNRLPSVMRSLGEGVVEFKKGMQGIEDDKDRSKEKEKIE